MIGHFIKIACRSFNRNKTVGLIKITKLSIGLRNFMPIPRYVHNEFEYDRYHKKTEKILEASVTNITSRSSKDIIKRVLLTSVITFQILRWVMYEWHNDLAHSVGINYSVFAMAGVIAILIAFLTVGYQAIKIALINPAQNLRQE